MYNFELMDEEEIVEIFEDIFVKQDDNEKETTIVLTNKRMLFLDYDKNDPNEIMRIGRGVEYLRYKEIYYTINLCDIEEIILDKFYKLILKNGIYFEFEDETLYKLLNKNI